MVQGTFGEGLSRLLGYQVGAAPMAVAAACENVFDGSSEWKKLEQDILNREFEYQLKEPNNWNLMKRFFRQYKFQLDQDERYEWALTALWKAVKGHRYDMGQKFTTSLWRYLGWEFNRIVQRKKAWKTRREQLSGIPLEDIAEPVRENAEEIAYANREFLSGLVQRLPRDQRIIVTEYYLNGRSMDEACVAARLTPDSGKSHLDKALARMRELAEESPAEVV